MWRLYLEDSSVSTWSHANTMQRHEGGAGGAALFQCGANVLFEVVNNDEIREVGQDVLDLEAVAFLHNLHRGLDALVLCYSKNSNFQPQCLAQHFICNTG